MEVVRDRLAFPAGGTAIASFFPGCSCLNTSLASDDFSAVSSSAKIVSSLDSTPARKDPHLEDDFCAVAGGDAISRRG